MVSILCFSKTTAKFKFHIYAGTEHAFFNDERLEIYSRPTVVTFQRGYGSGVMKMNFLSDGFAFLVLCFV